MAALCLCVTAGDNRGPRPTASHTDISYFVIRVLNSGPSFFKLSRLRRFSLANYASGTGASGWRVRATLGTFEFPLTMGFLRDWTHSDDERAALKCNSNIFVSTF